MRSRAAAIRLGIVVAVLVAIGVVGWRTGWFDYAALATRARTVRLHSSTAGAGILFVGAWAVLTPLGFPAHPLIITGGALFGTVAGTLLSLAGTLVGGAGGYVVARHLAPPPLRAWMRARLPADTVPARASFLSLVRMRLLPVVPFSAVNYAAGIAAVPWPVYITSTLVGQLPSTLVYTAFADRLLAAVGSREHVARDIVGLSALLLVISLIPWMISRWRAHR